MNKSRDFEIRFLSFQELKAKSMQFEESSIGTPYQSYNWLNSWMEHVGSKQDVMPLIVEGYVNGKTVFILPLMLQQYFGITVCKWLGGKEQNINAGLFDQEFISQNSDFIQNVFDEIRKYNSNISIFYLDKLPSSLNETKNPMLALCRPREHSNKLFTNVMGDDYKFWERGQRSKNSRNRMNRQWNKLEAKYSVVSVGLAENNSQISKMLNHFLLQRDEGYKKRGVPNPFSDNNIISFLQTAAENNENSTNGLQIHTLNSNGIIHAVHLGFFENSQYSGFANSFNLDSEKFSPGNLLQREILKIAHGYGIRKIDFGLGDTPYKYSWTNPVTLYDIVLPVKPAGFVAKILILNFLHLKLILKKIFKTKLFGGISRLAYKYLNR